MAFVEGTDSMLAVGGADVGPILEFPAELATDNDQLPVQNLIDLVNVGGEVLKFVLDFRFEELKLFRVDIGLADVVCEKGNLLRQGDHFPAAKFYLFDLVLSPAQEQLLLFLWVYH